MLGTVVYQWALMEPILLLFLPAQDRLIRSEMVLIYVTTLFAQAFSSMVFFNPSTFIALLGKVARDDCFLKSSTSEEFAYSSTGIATANIIKFVIVHGVKFFLTLGLHRTLRRGESVANHPDTSKGKTQRTFYLPRMSLPFLYTICYLILGLSAFFCLILGYSLSEEKYNMWQKDFIINIVANMSIKIVVEALKLTVLICEQVYKSRLLRGARRTELEAVANDNSNTLLVQPNCPLCGAIVLVPMSLHLDKHNSRGHVQKPINQL